MQRSFIPLLAVIFAAAAAAAVYLNPVPLNLDLFDLGLFDLGLFDLGLFDLGLFNLGLFNLALLALLGSGLAALWLLIRAERASTRGRAQARATYERTAGSPLAEWTSMAVSERLEQLELNLASANEAYVRWRHRSRAEALRTQLEYKLDTQNERLQTLAVAARLDPGQLDAGTGRLLHLATVLDAARCELERVTLSKDALIAERNLDWKQRRQPVRDSGQRFFQIWFDLDAERITKILPAM